MNCTPNEESTLLRVQETRLKNGVFAHLLDCLSFCLKLVIDRFLRLLPLLIIGLIGWWVIAPLVSSGPFWYWWGPFSTETSLHVTGVCLLQQVVILSRSLQFVCLDECILYQQSYSVRCSRHCGVFLCDLVSCGRYAIIPTDSTIEFICCQASTTITVAVCCALCWIHFCCISRCCTVASFIFSLCFLFRSYYSKLESTQPGWVERDQLCRTLLHQAAVSIAIVFCGSHLCCRERSRFESL